MRNSIKSEIAKPTPIFKMTTFCKNPNINLDKLVYQIPDLNSQIMFLPVLITKTLGHPTTWISISIV